MNAIPRFAFLLYSLLFIAGSVFASGKLIGYTGKAWKNDFGVLSGKCQSQAIDQMIKENKLQVAVLNANKHLSTVFSGEEVTTSIDIACFAHTLELVPTGKAVHWKNPHSNLHVHLTPGQHSRACRSFKVIKVHQGQKSQMHGIACSKSAPGQWEITETNLL